MHLERSCAPVGLDAARIALCLLPSFLITRAICVAATRIATENNRLIDAPSLQDSRRRRTRPYAGEMHHQIAWTSALTHRLRRFAQVAVMAQPAARVCLLADARTYVA